MSGLSPKFVCRTRPNETVLIKYGGNNGEVYGEMLATRLLWALGFGADRMYSVNVICRDCPETNAGIQRPAEEQRFDPALVERPMSEDEWKDDDKPGWAWTELDAVDPRAGGAPKAHRDALKLLAVFIQHTDSKPEQQRILCLGGLARNGSCRRPFLMISDLGLTFGRASRWNDNTASGVNLAEWRKEPVWTADPGCVGNLARSFTGTLDRPAISEDGRRFLADLLARLTDAQIRDLFTAARVQLRLREPGVVASGFATVEDWTAAFKEKRDQILRRRCAA
jgi:hypothetical protein